MTEKQVQQQLAAGFKGERVGLRRYPACVADAAKFSPKLELTRIPVGPLALKRLQSAKRAAAGEKPATEQPLEAKRAQRESPPQCHSPVIVSYPLSESLQRAIATAMKRRRKDQRTTTRRRKGQRSRPLARKKYTLPTQQAEPLKQQGQGQQGNGPPKEIEEMQCSEPSVSEPSMSKPSVSDPVMEIVHGNFGTTANDNKMEIQPDAVLQVSKGLIPNN